jgi:hypothetical protein
MKGGREMRRGNVYKVVLLGVVLLLLYMAALRPNVHIKLWFVVVWGIVAGITIIRMEVKDWLAGESELKLPPFVQFMLALVLVLSAVLATDWRGLSFRDVVQWAYAIFALPAYQQGLAWAWSRLRSEPTG